MLFNLGAPDLVVLKELILDGLESQLDLLSLLLHTWIISYSTPYPNPCLMLSILVVLLVRNLNIPLKSVLLLLLLDFFALLTQLAQAFIKLFLQFFEFLLLLLHEMLSVNVGNSQFLLSFKLESLDFL